MQISTSEEIRKCVVYVGIRREQEVQVRGTAFLVSYRALRFLVTARHNIESARLDGALGLAVRYNKKGGGLGSLNTEFSSWACHEDPYTDVAIMPVQGGMYNDMDVIPYEAANHVMESTIRDMPVTIGDDVVIPGLFSIHPGNEINSPLVRFGNLAMLQEKVRVDWFGDKVFVDAFLVEAQSMGGLSGSPVFVHFPERRRSKDLPDGMRLLLNVRKQTETCLLGVIHGHYSDKAEGINTGIAIVTPFVKVIETLDANLEKLKKGAAPEHP